MPLPHPLIIFVLPDGREVGSHGLDGDDIADFVRTWLTDETGTAELGSQLKCQYDDIDHIVLRRSPAG